MQLFAKADQSVAENQFEISLLQAIGTPVGTKKDDAITNSSLNKVSGTSIFFQGVTFSGQPLIRFRISCFVIFYHERLLRCALKEFLTYQSIYQFIEKYSNIEKQLLRGVPKLNFLKDVLNTHVVYSI